MWLQKLRGWLSLLLAIAVAWLAWVFYSRYTAQQLFEAKQKAEAWERAQKSVQDSGGFDLKITQFFAPPQVDKGQSFQLCFGVIHATRVLLDPPVAEIKPSLSRCENISLQKTSAFTLTAEDRKGHVVKETINVVVR
jgi:hypothetical protein